MDIDVSAIDNKALNAAIKNFNEVSGGDISGKGKKDEKVEAFLNAVDAIDEVVFDKLEEATQELFNDIVDLVTSGDEEEEVEEEDGEEVEEDDEDLEEEIEEEDEEDVVEDDDIDTEESEDDEEVEDAEDEEVEDAEDEEEPEPEPVKEEKPKKETKAKDKKKDGKKKGKSAAQKMKDTPKDEYGYIPGTQASEITKLIKEGKLTRKEIADKIGTTVGRVRNHENDLEKKKGWEILRKFEGEDKKNPKLSLGKKSAPKKVKE